MSASTGLRAFGDLRLSYDLRVPLDLVLKADATDNDAYVEFDAGSNLNAFWITIEAEFDSAALAFFQTAGTTKVIRALNAALAQRLYVSATSNDPSLPYWNIVGGIVDTEIVTANILHTIEVNRDSGTGDQSMYVDGDLIETASSSGGSRYFRFGMMNTSGADDIGFITSVKIGTTQGGTDIFTDDFSSGDLSAWTTTSGDVSVVSNPF